MALDRIIEEVGLVRIGIWQELFVIAHDLVPSREYDHISDISLVVIEPVGWHHYTSWIK